MNPPLPGDSGPVRVQQARPGGRTAGLCGHHHAGPSWHEILRLIDSTPLPCSMSRGTVKRSDLSGHADCGSCASHWRFFWGFRLYLISTPEGMPVIWGLANPKLGEREVTQALLEREHRHIHAGQVIHAQRPTRPGTPRRTYSRRRLRTSRLKTPCTYRRDLAQLAHQHPSQRLPHRLRPQNRQNH